MSVTIPDDLRWKIVSAATAVRVCRQLLDRHIRRRHSDCDHPAVGNFGRQLATLDTFLTRVLENGMGEFYRMYDDVADILRTARRQSTIVVTRSTAARTRECHAFLDNSWGSLQSVLNELPPEAKRPKERMPRIEVPVADFDEVLAPLESRLTDGIRLQIADVAGTILRQIGNDPREWLALGSRRFEELLAEIWSGFGWQTVLTPPVRDGGFDVRAVRNEHGITLCYLVEAKCYAPDRPVGVEIVRQLVGVVERERASHGVIATTSHYTKGAHTEVRDREYRVTLADFNAVLDWVRVYRQIQNRR